MYSVFESLPEEKKNNIIQCALKEFADKGYEQASTNTIVKNAGISKGILFHYFNTKKDLFRYILFYGMEILYTRMIELMNFTSDDYFERMLEVSAVKMKITLEYPEISDIVLDIFKSNHKDLIAELYDKYMPLMSEFFAKVNTGMDLSKFKEGTDINRVNELVTWIAEGISDKLLAGSLNMYDSMEKIRAVVEDEFIKYIELLKAGVYK